MPTPYRKAAGAPVHAVSWIGRQGTRAVAALVFIGIALPPLGALLRPFVTEAIFLLLCVSFMRVDLAALRRHLRRPGLVLAATVWTVVIIPLVVGFACLAIGFDRHAPGLFLGLMLQTAASPMMAAPALAALMGLDATLVLISLVATTALVPFTAPLFAYAFLGTGLTLTPSVLGVKLFAILAGSLLVAAIIRRIAGPERIERHRDPIDGLNILLLLVFVSAVMGNVVPSFVAAPLPTAAALLLAFAMFFVLFGSTMLIFRKFGKEYALVLGLLVAQRNMGLMLAATGGVLPETTWLYFALSQFPIYLTPQLLRPLARASTARASQA